MTRAAAVPPAPILSAAPSRRANRALMGSNMMPMMPGAMFGNRMIASRARPFTGQEVRRIVDGRLAVHGLSRLKVGTVEAADDTTFTVDIVTLDDSLAVRLTVEKQSGRVMSVE